MRVTKIAFKGYQRLIDTSCSTAGKLIAFLGPNEAGKTTLLRALDWFSNGGALPSSSQNKIDPPDSDASVVEVTYWLDEEDARIVDTLGLVEPPKFYIRGRNPLGGYTGVLEPRPRRAPDAFAGIASEFSRVLTSESEMPLEGAESNLANFSGTVQEVLGSTNSAWNDDWDGDYDSSIQRLDDLGEKALSAELVTLRELLRLGDPSAAARDLIRPYLPGFVLFTEADRVLLSAYELGSDELRANPPSALANLAWIADLSLEDLWQSIQAVDRRDVGTRQRRANERLRAGLSSRWSQRELGVEFNVNGTELEILIFEHSDDGAVTPVEERSDGLKTFIALAAFLARHDFDVPPVLLVDEAETHLHYDAQADLVEVLTKDLGATQVFYTTHSPGCLPRDLGTGIRLVKPSASRSDESTIRNDFWSSDSPGFTPLLFAMGAGAAAFSAFRKAVLTEGAADMILLPTLLRLATGKLDLDFQVAPGIANYHGSGLELEEVAARVVYLVDGDQGGTDHIERLLAMDIPEDRIKQLEAGKAIEDYVHPDLYVRLVNEYFSVIGTGAEVQIDQLDSALTIAKALEVWCEASGVRPPGKTVIPTKLVEDPELGLADGAKEALISLHSELMKALNAKPSRRR